MFVAQSPCSPEQNACDLGIFYSVDTHSKDQQLAQKLAKSNVAAMSRDELVAVFGEDSASHQVNLAQDKRKLDALRMAVEKAWESLPVETLLRVFDTLNTTVADAIIAAKGGNTMDYHHHNGRSRDLQRQLSVANSTQSQEGRQHTLSAFMSQAEKELSKELNEFRRIRRANLSSTDIAQGQIIDNVGNGGFMNDVANFFLKSCRKLIN